MTAPEVDEIGRIKGEPNGAPMYLVRNNFLYRSKKY